MQELHVLKRRMDRTSFFKNQADVWIFPGGKHTLSPTISEACVIWRT